MPKFTGECRIAGVNGNQNRVRVTDGDMVWDDVDEMGYRMMCYKPDFDELPWCGGIEPTPPTKS